MNQALWEKIKGFDFDQPMSEYSFSVRLAHENFWTEEFTQKAILEYKKFMYLAAISDQMVSPSEIIDKVWHEHLVFTKSYEEFCELLGKQIHHIPSTHQKGEFEKFQQAKVHTSELYQTEFGEQPSEFWNQHSMYDSLNLKKAKVKLRTKLLVVLSLFVILFFPLYSYFSPIIRLMSDRIFLWGFFISGVLLILVMEFYNQSKMRRLIKGFSKDSFFFHLSADELIYLKTRNIKTPILGILHELVEKGWVRINSDKKIELLKNNSSSDPKENQVLEVIKHHEIMEFEKFQRIISSKKIFQNLSNSMEAFVKYVHKSQRYHRIFIVNVILYSLFMSFGFIRLKLGINNNEPIGYLVFLLLLFSIGFIVVLATVTQFAFSRSIKRYYKHVVLPEMSGSENWKLSYYLFGSSVLAASFAPITGYNRNKSNGGCGTSGCASSGCGSSCGGGCGGCGG